MAEYVIQRRERCPDCFRGINLEYCLPEFIEEVENGARKLLPITYDGNLSDLACPRQCDGGFIRTEVNLLDVLAELRFDIGGDDGRSCFIAPRMDEDHEAHISR